MKWKKPLKNIPNQLNLLCYKAGRKIGSILKLDINRNYSCQTYLYYVKINHLINTRLVSKY